MRATEREGVIDEILEKMALFEIAPGDLGKTDGQQRAQSGDLSKLSTEIQ